MKMAIMQPYFFPYIGYFQLIASVDVFVLYDNVKYTKKGWINRNRLLRNGQPVSFSLPLKKNSDYLHIVDRELAVDYSPEKLINQFKGAYATAPYFSDIFPLIEPIVRHDDKNLFAFICQSIEALCRYLDIPTEIKTSSHISINHDLKGQDKVIALCCELGASTYINSIGGMELYSWNDFNRCGVDLKFLRSGIFEYTQFSDEFVPWLSIVDVLMFNSKRAIHDYLISNYELI